MHGKTPLAAAAANNHLEVTHCLVHAGCDVNALDHERLSPLLWATQNGHLQVMRSLIDAKADKDATNDREETLLFLVASNGYATAVRVLTEAGADKEKADESNYTPLPLDDHVPQRYSSCYQFIQFTSWNSIIYICLNSCFPKHITHSRVSYDESLPAIWGILQQRMGIWKRFMCSLKLVPA